VSKGFFELGLFGLAQIKLDDFFDAVFAENNGDADEVAVHVIFAIAISTAGHYGFVIFQDCFGHFNDAGGRGVIGAVAEEIYDFNTAFSGALD